MKTQLQTLALVAALSLSAGAVQAGDQPCPVNQPAPAAQSMVLAEMARIEAAMRSGQITPYEAGRLTRQQWEIAQFQRGFLEGGAAPQGETCMSGPTLDLAPLGDMAKAGMQTAVTMMRAVMKETTRLIQENVDQDEPPL